jgi:hypothetical protein
MVVVEFSGIFVLPVSYSLKSGFADQKRHRLPYMQSWELEGRVVGQWQSLDRQENTQVLSDGLDHEFRIFDFPGGGIEAVRLRQTGRNRCGTSYMYLGRFSLNGYVIRMDESIEEAGVECAADARTVRGDCLGLVDRGVGPGRSWSAELADRPQPEQELPAEEPVAGEALIPIATHTHKDLGAAPCQDTVLVDERALMSSAVRDAA